MPCLVTQASALDLFARLKPRRRIEGVSAVLLPVNGEGRFALDAWDRLLERTWRAGLTPAINMIPVT